MRARLRSWWQKIKQHRVPIGVGAIVLVVVIVLILIGYRFDWTGFDSGTSQIKITSKVNYTATVSQPSKSLWDWLQLLIIPVVLAVGALLFNLANTRTEQKIAAQRYEQDKNLALDKQREDLLQTYLDRMSAVAAEVRNVARARTINILFQLNASRIEYVFAFLRESGLMSIKSNESIVSFYGADLKKINFSHADLRRTNLNGADLTEVNLSGACFYEANLSEANLSKANLIDAFSPQANLSDAILFNADLSSAILDETDLSDANLFGANLSRTSLSGADLNRTTGTIPEQLKQAESLAGATMPDGSIHE